MSVHPVDRLAGLIYRIESKRTRVFPGGWGDEEMLALFESIPDGEPPAIALEWSPKSEHQGFRRQRGRFHSPIADRLPEPIRAVPVERTEPAGGAERIVVLLPAWNDHGFATRRKLAVQLAALGLASISYDIPLYGRRRVVPEPLQAIRTVADFALMGYGAVSEARALLAHFRQGYQTGVSGYSMGGNLAALASATLPFGVATAPLAASHSPGPVYLDGVIRAAIDWQALGGRDQAQRLRAELSKASALNHPPLPHHRAAVIVGARSDGFVPEQTTIDLAAHWEGSELRWVDGGHATLLWRHRPLLASAIRDSFERFYGPA